MKPINNKIKLDIREIQRMGMDTGAIEEHGTILEVGDGVGDSFMTTTSSNGAMYINNKYPIGATLYFKAWSIDIITVGDKKHYFISADSEAICAIDTTNIK